MTTLAEQIATLESQLAAYESRNVPLSADDACRIWEDDPDDRIGPSCLAVARAALVAAESPVAVKAAFKVWDDEDASANPYEVFTKAIRAAHDAAIDGGCSAARENNSLSPLILREFAALFNEQPQSAAWCVGRFIGEVANLRERVATLEENARCGNETLEKLNKERDDLRRQLDALTRPIDGVEELGRIGWRASLKDERANPEIDAGDIRQAQAIASRVIGALRSAYIEACGHGAGLYAQYFDRAVASLKIEPAKVEPATPVDTRPVVKVGQVWGSRTSAITFRVVDVDTSVSRATDQNGRRMPLTAAGKPMSDNWVFGAPPPKREPFELVSTGRPIGEYAATPNECAIRDRIREIERRLEAGGL